MTLLLALLLFICMNALNQQLKSVVQLRASGENMICLKSQVTLLKDYMRFIRSTNQSIRLAKAASLVPKTRVVALGFLKKLKQAQSYRSKIFNLNQRITKHCKRSWVITKFKNPYQRDSKIIRGMDDAAIVVNPISQSQIQSRRLKHYFVKAQISHKRSPQLTKITMHPKVSSYSKPLYGQLSFL